MNKLLRFKSAVKKTDLLQDLFIQELKAVKPVKSSASAQPKGAEQLKELLSAAKKEVTK